MNPIQEEDEDDIHWTETQHRDVIVHNEYLHASGRPPVPVCIAKMLDYKPYSARVNLPRETHQKLK